MLAKIVTMIVTLSFETILCIRFCFVFAVLRRLVVFGFKDPAGNGEVLQFLNMVFHNINVFLHLSK